MSQLFSQRSRHSTWRKLWLSLAESEKELGVDTITDEALEQMRDHLTVNDEDFEVARIEEKSRRHVRFKPRYYPCTPFIKPEIVANQTTTRMSWR